MPRESGQVIDRSSRRRRVALAGWRVALALTASACLVTSNSDLPTPTDIPDVRAQAPNTFSQVATVGDPDCPNNMTEPATQFRVTVRYADTQTDNLFLQLYVAGAGLYGSPLQLRHNGTEMRAPMNELCVPNERLSKPCNHVAVAVSTSLDKFQTTPDRLDPDVHWVEWYLLPSVVVDPNLHPQTCSDSGVP